MFKIKGGYEDLWKAIIRPPRDEYNQSDLGRDKFTIGGVPVQRTDIVLQNTRKLNLQCSWFEPINKPCEQLPCVIYLHGNSSSRLEALPCIKVLLPSHIMLFCFDFSGCGKSDGEYISLGWFEREDVDVVVKHLRNSNKVSTIGLWGRSMGAATALMHADRDPSIAGLVVDSGFTSLRKLADDLVTTYTKIPKFIVSPALSFVKKTIMNKAKFDINNLRYAGDKNIVESLGDHNSPREEFLLDSIGIFFYNTLQCEFLIPKNSEKKEKPKIPKYEKIEELNFEKKLNIGNENNVFNALNEFEGGEDFDEDEELKKAIEESLKLSKQEEEKNKNKNNNVNQPNNPIFEQNLHMQNPKNDNFPDKNKDINKF